MKAFIVSCYTLFNSLQKYLNFIQELHHGSFINMLLPIMELAFKGSNEVKIRAFQAWQALIDNFATNYGERIIR